MYGRRVVCRSRRRRCRMLHPGNERPTPRIDRYISIPTSPCLTGNWNRWFSRLKETPRNRDRWPPFLYLHAVYIAHIGDSSHSHVIGVSLYRPFDTEVYTVGAEKHMNCEDRLVVCHPRTSVAVIRTSFTCIQNVAARFVFPSPSITTAVFLLLYILISRFEYYSTKNSTICL